MANRLRLRKWSWHLEQNWQGEARKARVNGLATVTVMRTDAATRVLASRRVQARLGGKQTKKTERQIARGLGKVTLVEGLVFIHHYILHQCDASCSHINVPSIQTREKRMNFYIRDALCCSQNR
ncbi:hypothetical protein Y1Q_0022568 [Alligator mississippiensis]|uniref:Uncharacterized protein n=1 Tax=Alligator mississippiensis TaxID=8496 RepID=A0A151NQA8_ALLMI|nr:hypothetical protein Y1Q_0022568 [Alligator mississippiensis]